MPLQIITANELCSGKVIYLNASNIWVDNLTLARAYDIDKEGIDISNITNEVIKNNNVIGIYTISVRQNGNEIIPISMKERIRSLGPTVTPNMGFLPNSL